jgi:hypothetical protein
MSHISVGGEPGYSVQVARAAPVMDVSPQEYDDDWPVRSAALQYSSWTPIWDRIIRTLHESSLSYGDNALPVSSTPMP